ncbi:PAS domain-containing protein [bacterium]|nr:PAS domain-containing protein [bacterium]
MKENSQIEKPQNDVENITAKHNSDAHQVPLESKADEISTSPDNTKEESNEEKESSSFPIVGMGASAGGLEAFEKFFANMPLDNGMAFVLVPHLDPDHKSMMVELLKRSTKMNVLEVEDGMEVQPNCVYVIPPNNDMGIMNRKLQLMEPTQPRGFSLPIDFFLRSLAQDQGEHAICIILSGTGSSGTLGLKAIKGEGGLVMVQEPEDAKYDGMPRSAISTGLVDYILPAEKMPAQLISYVEHSNRRYVKEKTRIDKALGFLQKIFMIIRNQTGQDFSLYKPNTIRRRIERRMVLHQIDNLEDYVRYLQKNAHEVEMLFKELLIGVTNFFRDPEAFEILKKDVLPQLLENKSSQYPVRIWVPGCSTGEEAYSIAINLREYTLEQKRDFRVQIFATDIDNSAIEIARGGIYPESIAVDVSDDRLNRFFTKEGNNYHIKTEIREMVVFAVQNITKDPPFSKLDLISCRNLLIYFAPELQKKILPLFHYILKENGVLFLGSSETIGGFIDLFSALNNKWKFFTRKDLPSSAQVVVDFPSAYVTAVDIVEQINGAPTELRNTSIVRMSERLLLDNYAPPCALINEKYEILYFHGRTGKYLEPAEGEARLDIVEMAREGLKGKLMSAIRESLSRKGTVVHKSLQVKINSGYQMVNVTVKPIGSPEVMKGLMMVVFEDVAPNEHSELSEIKSESSVDMDQRITELEQELNYTKETLHTTIEELETSNEELKSTNEELQSTNEELQSTNEELETSKEELQSLNEELTTVNAELQGKIEQLSDSNNDMKNLLDSTNIATIFLDNDRCIKRFTQEATNIINLIETDIGRPIDHIVSKLIYEYLVEDVNKVLRTLVYEEKEVKTRDGNWYVMRIVPYRTTDNVIDGVVITFVDINEQKQSQQAIQDAREYAENIFETMRTPLIVLNADLQIISANRSFYKTFKVMPSESQEQNIYDLGNRQWDIPKLRELLEEIIPNKTTVENFRVEHHFPDTGRRVMLLNARQVYQESKESQMILVAIEDITEHELS